MSAKQDLPRRLASYYDTEPPLRAPDWVLQAALSTVESTAQRRGLAALRRYPPLSQYTKLAAAAVVVIAAAGFTLWQLGPRSGGGPSVPSPSPVSTPVATVAPGRTAAPEPTTYVVAPLTRTFTSPQYGYSLSYPANWGTQAATEIWREGVLPDWGDPTTDTVHDVTLLDHLFVGAGSQPLKGATLLEWQAALLDADKCGGTDPVVVDGDDGFIGRNCQIALVQVGDRGYIFGLWASNDDPELADLDKRALFRQILDTVRLQPDAAAN